MVDWLLPVLVLSVLVAAMFYRRARRLHNRLETHYPGTSAYMSDRRNVPPRH